MSGMMTMSYKQGGLGQGSLKSRMPVYVSTKRYLGIYIDQPKQKLATCHARLRYQSSLPVSRSRIRITVEKKASKSMLISSTAFSPLQQLLGSPMLQVFSMVDDGYWLIPAI